MAIKKASAAGSKISPVKLRLATRPFPQRRFAGQAVRGFAQRLFAKHGLQRWAPGLTLTLFENREGARSMNALMWSRASYLINKTWFSFNPSLMIELHAAMEQRIQIGSPLRAQILFARPSVMTHTRFASLEKASLRVDKSLSVWEKVRERFTKFAGKEPLPSSSRMWSLLLHSFAEPRASRINLSAASAAMRSFTSLSRVYLQNNTQRFSAHFARENRFDLFSSRLRRETFSFADKFTSTTKLTQAARHFFSNRLSRLLHQTLHHTLSARRELSDAAHRNGSRAGNATASITLAIPDARLSMPSPQRMMTPSHRFAFAPEMVLAQKQVALAESQASPALSANLATAAKPNGAPFPAVSAPSLSTPEIDINRLTERVYAELEHKMKNERIRRGL